MFLAELFDQFGFTKNPCDPLRPTLRTIERFGWQRHTLARVHQHNHFATARNHSLGTTLQVKEKEDQSNDGDQPKQNQCPTHWCGQFGSIAKVVLHTSKQ